MGKRNNLLLYNSKCLSLLHPSRQYMHEIRVYIYLIYAYAISIKKYLHKKTREITKQLWQLKMYVTIYHYVIQYLI
jgi:hypothetical protein